MPPIPRGGNCATGSGAAITSLGYNLASDATCSLTQPTDQPGAAPLLGPLATNGGRTQTHALLNGSPALDAVPNGTNGCGADYTTDQRNKTRPVDAGGGAKCDVGAYERQSNELIAQECSLPQGSQFDFNTLTPGVNVKVTRNSGDDPGCVTALKRSEWPGGSQNAGEFQVIWTLTAANTTYNLDLMLCYTEAELASAGVSNENTITAYRWDESYNAWNWVNKGGTVDADANCVTVAGVTALSPWTIAGDGAAPTAITLRAFAPRAATTWLPPLGLWALCVIAWGMWCRRHVRRRA